MDSPFMTRVELAQYLRMSVSWLAQGNGPKPHPGYGRRVLYHRETVEEWSLCKDSTETPSQESTNSDSNTKVSATNDPLVAEIEERLKKDLDKFEQKSNETHQEENEKKAKS